MDSSIKNLAEYYEVKYNDTARYELLQGYARAVEKGDISPLVGFDQYEEVNRELLERVVGVTAPNGTTIESFATHFIDRVIGQTSTPHPGMRCGVPIDDAVEAITYGSPSKMRELADGDLRQTLTGNHAEVTLSVRDKRVIQINPKRKGR